MENCKNCRYWNQSRKIVDHVSDCDFVDNRQVIKGNKTYFGIDVSVSDDSGLICVLLTGEDFGCVNFAEKHKKNLSSN